MGQNIIHVLVLDRHDWRADICTSKLEKVYSKTQYTEHKYIKFMDIVNIWQLHISFT
jgi:hypothetical protein